MTKELWLNLPVKNLKKSKEFFTKIGFSFKNREMENMIAMEVGEKKVAVMLLDESTFKNAAQNEITDTNQSSEILISFDAESREEVDELAQKAEAAGGTVFGKPSEIQGWMYGCGFTDLDGHRWNALYMEMSKMPQG
ncbi:VOC family protein [Rhodohalobacter sp. 614A]|uniref:VOC family protein n=1 Tax=Rhodohalobacter sp. 614A TaxID=2908649 RepID=UPI001F2FA42C|nr:VOC family protein [Rhodohalobacter sp. 614A]